MCDTFISGLAFYKIANWSYCSRYPINLDFANIKLNDLVFINLDDFDNFMNIVTTNSPRNKFNLIAHNSDKCFTPDHLTQLKPYVNRVFATNNICQDDITVTIPLGFSDIPELNDTQIVQNKEILIYMNFDISTNQEKRSACYNLFKDQQYVTKGSGLPVSEFYNFIAKSKYVLCPESTSIDSHRIYESIYFNAIPVITKTPMERFFKNLPVLIVEDWSQVNEEFLNTNYEALFNNLKTWKEKNANWLDPRYWLSTSLNNNQIPYISFSLYGNNPVYTRGMVINAQIISKRFPCFRTQIYIVDDVPQDIRQTLLAIPSVRVIPVDRNGHSGNMFDRFKAIDEPDCLLMLVRDADSRIHDRDAACIEDFLISNKQLQIIRDHPYHGTPILGGLWGIRKEAISSPMTTMIDKWISDKTDFPKGTDQAFLAEIIYPLLISNSIIHDRIGFFEPRESHTPFRVPIVDLLFCGQVHYFNETGE
jgi:hypothetical protein